MVDIAGGEEVLAGPGERSARLSWDEVFEAAPEVIVLMPCGFDADRAVEEAGRVLPRLPGWGDLPAVKEGRVWAVDANSHFSRPAPRLVEGVEILARILHPEASRGAGDSDTPCRASPVDPEPAGFTPGAVRTGLCAPPSPSSARTARPSRRRSP